MDKLAVTFVDAIPGSGKSYHAILDMANGIRAGKKYIYITPFLSEVNRVRVELVKKHRLEIFEPTGVSGEQ